MSYLTKHKATLSDRFNTQGGGELKTKNLRLIKLLLVVYVYDAAQGTFKQVPSMPAHMPLQIHNAMKALQLINEGKVLL